MIALGWCFADQVLPDPLRHSGAGDVVVLCAPLAQATTARDRLFLLQHAFDAGVDLVPLAASRLWSVAEAAGAAQEAAEDLQDQLTAIKGRGQLTLRVDWPADPVDQITGLTGRDWLHHLRNRQVRATARAAMAETVLQNLSAAIAAPRTPVRAEGAGFASHLLLARHDLSHLLQRILTAARAQSLPDGGSVTVSGLWPAFAFVRAPQCPELVSP